MPPARDLVLEIEVDGAGQIKAQQPDAILIFVLPPTRDEQQRRLVGRGDPHAKVAERLQKAEDEEPVGMALADHVVVNGDLEQTIKEMLDIIEAERSGSQGGPRASLPPSRGVIPPSGTGPGKLVRLAPPEDRWLARTTR